MEAAHRQFLSQKALRMLKGWKIQIIHYKIYMFCYLNIKAKVCHTSALVAPNRITKITRREHLLGQFVKCWLDSS